MSQKEKRKNAEVAITGTLTKEQVTAVLERTLARIQREVEIQGFRKGKAPADKVRAYIGEGALWKEASEEALKGEVENVLKEHSVMPIMPVSAALKASDVDADVPFEIIAVVAPTCSIENAKETAKKAAHALPALDDEKEQTAALQALRAQARAMVQSTAKPISEAESGRPARPEDELRGDPETVLSDDEAKKLGFENSLAVEHFLKEESERAVKERALQKKRAAIAEALIQKAECDIPRVLIADEARALVDATKRDVAAQGIPFNEYLTRIGKTEDQVRVELEVPAEKRVALDIIFGEIARGEKITADEKEEERLSHALVEQGVEHERAHQYVRATVMREKVWELLGAPAVSKMPAEPVETDTQD